MNFFDRVGSMIYGEDWSDRFAAQLNPKRRATHNSQEGMAQTVRDEVCSALSAGLAQATTVLSVCEIFDRDRAIAELRKLVEANATNGSDIPFKGRRPRGFAYLELPADVWNENRDKWRTILDARPNVRESKENVKFNVNTSYWDLQNDTEINWQDSTCSIPVSFLSIANPSATLFHAKNKEVADVFEFSGDRVNEAPIYVHGADRALAQIFQTPLPDQEWLDRYKQYRTNFVPELIAAAWREIALTGITPEWGAGKEIITAMEAYVANQGLDPEKFGTPEQSTLDALGYNILEQLRKKRTDTSVLVKSYKPQRKSSKKPAG